MEGRTVKTIALQVHDIAEMPICTGWYYVVCVDADLDLLAIDWLKFDGQAWCWHGQQVDTKRNQMRYWFDLVPVVETNTL